MTKRLRVIRYHVRVEAVSDDGADLEPLDMQPIAVPAAGWDAFVESLPEQLTAAEADLNGPPTPA